MALDISNQFFDGLAFQIRFAFDRIIDIINVGLSDVWCDESPWCAHRCGVPRRYRDMLTGVRCMPYLTPSIIKDCFAGEQLRVSVNPTARKDTQNLIINDVRRMPVGFAFDGF